MFGVFEKFVPDDLLIKIKDVLSNEYIRKITQNINFDFQFEL